MQEAHTIGAELSATKKQYFYITSILYDSSISSHKTTSISVGNLEDILAIEYLKCPKHSTIIWIVGTCWQ